MTCDHVVSQCPMESYRVMNVPLGINEFYENKVPIYVLLIFWAIKLTECDIKKI